MRLTLSTMKFFAWIQIFKLVVKTIARRWFVCNLMAKPKFGIAIQNALHVLVAEGNNAFFGSKGSKRNAIVKQPIISLVV